MRPERREPGPGQESVWDYPRPPRLERVEARITVEFNGEVIADTTGAYRVLETSHPPTYYLPPGDFKPGVLVDAPGGSFCEWKGQAVYHTVRAGDREAPRAAWSYPEPTPGFEPMAGYVAVYARLMDRCTVGEHEATPQPGGFYGGWVTPDLAGPFKGEPGTEWW